MFVLVFSHERDNIGLLKEIHLPTAKKHNDQSGRWQT